jgi:SPP1 gp7 family putative phage head morphogenesis protein
VKQEPATAPIAFGFDVFNPQILEAIRRLVFDFAQSTLVTRKQEVEAAYAQLQAELAEGLEQGETIRNLARRIQGIFDDPQRAYVIARTEAMRATQAGSVLAAQKSGVVQKKQWLASSLSCPECKALAGKEVALDQPFVILPGGGSYAVVYHPPYHPNCTCDITYVLSPEYT